MYFLLPFNLLNFVSFGEAKALRNFVACVMDTAVLTIIYFHIDYLIMPLCVRILLYSIPFPYISIFSILDTVLVAIRMKNNVSPVLDNFKS